MNYCLLTDVYGTDFNNVNYTNNNIIITYQIKNIQIK